MVTGKGLFHLEVRIASVGVYTLVCAIMVSVDGNVFVCVWWELERMMDVVVVSCDHVPRKRAQADICRAGGAEGVPWIVLRRLDAQEGDVEGLLTMDE